MPSTVSLTSITVAAGRGVSGSLLTSASYGPRGFSHALILSEGRAVDAGLLTDVLTPENLSKAFGQSIALDIIDGRYFARRTRSRAAHRRR